MYPLLFKGPTILLAIGCELCTLWVYVLLSFKVVLPYMQLYHFVVLYLLHVLFYAVLY